jgi:hypothetical protein
MICMCVLEYSGFSKNLLIRSWLTNHLSGWGCYTDGRTGRILGGWVIERSGDAVCDLHRACGDEEREFLD